MQHGCLTALTMALAFVLVTVLLFCTACSPDAVVDATTTTTQAEGATTVNTTVTTAASKSERDTTVKTNRTTKTTVTTTATVAAPAVKLTAPQNGYTVAMQAPMVDYYLSITDEQKAAEFWKKTYTGTAQAGTVTLSWESTEKQCRVFVSENPQFGDTNGVLTAKTELTLTNLLPARTYYWKVGNGKGEYSETRTFVTEDTPVRWIAVDGGDNIRDLGGWKAGGKTVKYGMLYRGGCIDGYGGGPLLTAAGKITMKQELGIRTELDLRGGDVGTNGSPFGGLYQKTTMTQYDLIFTDEKTKQSLGTIFSLLSNENMYPFYFHCNAGADRTGTLSFIINGLLGVSYDDLTRDFELTGFSSRGQRLRSAIDPQTGLFKENGIMQSNAGNHIAWGPLYREMMSRYGTGSGTLSDAIANFLKTECGVTQTEIDAVRRILLV